MIAKAEQAVMTAEELLALPDDGVERWLIDGKLREGRQGMTVRNRFHSRVTTRVSKFLDNWLDEQPAPRGWVTSGESGVRLRRNPDCVVGIDVVYVSATVLAAQTDETALIEGVPVLAVEILSPNDVHDDVEEKIDTYLDAGVAFVWVVNVRRRTVTIHRPRARPEMVNDAQELSGEPHLPGFRVEVALLFE